MALSRKQLGKVHTAVAQLGLPDEAYRELLAALGVESATELDNAGLDMLLDAFVELGFTDYARRRSGFGQRPGMATDPQVRLIASLWRQWSGHNDEQALDHWLERFFGVSSIRFLPQERASKAIDALRAMVKRRRGQGRTPPAGPTEAAK
ncbi:MAG TPA: regulatory protein GemA [Longimicrobiales bacterium]